MTRRHLPSPKSSLRMFARLDERGIDDSMTFTRGPGSWSTQVAEAVDGDTFVEVGTSEDTPRHPYSAALGRRGFHMEPTRTNRVSKSLLTDVTTADELPDGWAATSGAAGVDFETTVAGSPTGGPKFRLLDTNTNFRGATLASAIGALTQYAMSAWVRRTGAGGAAGLLGIETNPATYSGFALSLGPHDWERVSHLATTVGANGGIFLLTADTDPPGVIEVACPQVEEGAYPTSPILGDAVVTRAAELCAIDPTLIASDGVLEIEYVPQFASTAFASSDTIWTWANGWRLDYDGSDDAIHLIVNGNSEIESAALAFAADTKFELQVRWGSWGTRLSVNGVVLTDGTAWGTPTPAAYLGSGAASAQCEAKIFGDVRIAR